MEYELEPCPFCGGKEIVVLNYCPLCTKCGATRNSVEQWNTRAPKPMPECVRAMDDFVMRCQGNLTMDILETEADEVRATVREHYGEKP